MIKWLIKTLLPEYPKSKPAEWVDLLYKEIPTTSIFFGKYESNGSFIAVLQKNNLGDYRIKFLGDHGRLGEEYIMRKCFWEEIQEDKLRSTE